MLADPFSGLLGGNRQWLWQTCTEFGFFHTCEEGSDCPFAKGYHPVEKDLELCEKSFGLSANEVEEAIQETAQHYGGASLLNGSRILSLHGDVDPWSTLARQESSTDQELPSMTVKDASHHIWTHVVKPSDSEEVRKARQFIYDTVINWLGLNENTRT